VYSPSGLVTLIIPFEGMRFAAGTAAGLSSRGPGEDGVVDLFPLAEFAIEFFHFQRAGDDLVELFRVGAVGAFNGAVEFGGTRGQHEQVQVALLKRARS
jgi:hypothetical protein